MEFGVWSIVPPIVAIVLAIWTKEVFSALLLGIISGILIFTGGDIYESFKLLGSIVGDQINSHGLMLLFLGLLGSLVVVVTKAGGSFAYGKWASSKIKSKSMAQLATVFLGMIIFIDDYFNCLTVGTVMKPVTDRYKISRAKLAYLIDATAAPICIIAPISSWAASVISVIDSTQAKGGMFLFLKSIPFNLYAILTIIMVVYFCFSKRELGFMAEHEVIDNSIDESNNAQLDVKVSDKGTVFDLVIPVLTLISVTVLFMYLTGNEEVISNGLENSFTEIFGNANTNLSLVIGAFSGVFISFIMFIPRKLLTFNEFMSSMSEGVKSMVSAIMILILAWSLGEVTKEEFLNTGVFIARLVEQISVVTLLPALIFALGALMSFSTGTAWGTFSILIPIVVPIVFNLGVTEMFPIILAAVFSGSIFGDHASPISDTSILSSAAVGCRHIEHVRTQLPYALSVAFATSLGFLAGGFTNSVIITFAVGVASLYIITALGLRFWSEDIATK